MIGFKKRLLLLFGVASLMACSDPVERVLTEYPKRLERVLEVEGVSNAETAVKPVVRPSRRQLLLPLEQADINLLEFLKLNQCQLGQVVGEKNSVLGKLAQGSQYMHMERDFLIFAPACIAALEDQKLVQALGKALEVKQDQRMNVWWNAWIASEEFQQLTSISVYPLALSEEAHLQHTLLGFEFAVQQGGQWQQQDFEYRTADVEHHLRQWSLGESLGRWQTTQARLTDILEQTTAMVEQRQQERPLCPTGQKTRKADIVRNVLERFYVGELQPYMSLSDRFGHELLHQLQRIEALMDDTPVVWTRWLNQLHESRARFQQASRTHVQVMSRLFDSCGMNVGKPR